MRDSLGRQPNMNTLRHQLLIACIVIATSFGQGHSTLTRDRCTPPTSGDSAALIRVSLDPPSARSPALSLALQRIALGDSGRRYIQPPLGVDTVRNIPPGLYLLSVRLIGYWPPRDTIRLGPGEAWCFTAHLVRDTIELKSIY
jgi:hypothetical protein